MKPKLIINNSASGSNELFKKLKSKPELFKYKGKTYMRTDITDDKALIKKAKQQGIEEMQYKLGPCKAIEIEASVVHPTHLCISDREFDHEFIYTCINHFTSRSNYTVVYFNNRDLFLYPKTLGIVDEMLPAYWFYRLRRGLIIYRGAIDSTKPFDGNTIFMLNKLEFKPTSRDGQNYIDLSVLPLLLLAIFTIQSCRNRPIIPKSNSKM